MLKEPDLKEIERKAYIFYNQDGLLDIFTSIYIIGFAVGILLDFIWDYSFGLFIPAMLVALVLPLWITAKRKITMPRIGFVKFGSRGSKKVLTIFTGLMVLGLAFLMLFTLFRGQSWLYDSIIANGLILVGVGGLAVSFLLGYASGLNRLYSYGLLVLALFLVAHFLGVFFAYMLLVLGATVMFVGFVLLVRFVRKYPLKGDPTVVQQ